MKDDTKVVATSNATELVNATEVASIEQSNTNIMEKKEISENGNAANAASNELKSWGKDMGIKPTGKSSVSCPLKPSDSAPLKHSTMPP